MCAHQFHKMPRGKRPLLYSSGSELQFITWSDTQWITEEKLRSQQSIPLCPGSFVPLSHDSQGWASMTLLSHSLLSPLGWRSPFLIANMNLSCRNQHPSFVSLEQWRIANDCSQHLWAFSSPISSVYFCLGVEIASDFSYRRCELISYACPWGPGRKWVHLPQIKWIIHIASGSKRW